MVVRITPTIRTTGYARMGGMYITSGGEPVPNSTQMPDFEKVSDAQLVTCHCPLQRGGAGRGVPPPRRGRLRSGQTGDGQRRRGGGRDPGDLPPPVEPTGSLRPGPGLAALVPAGPGPRSCRRRHPLARTRAGCREARDAFAPRAPPTTCSTRSGIWPWPIRSRPPWGPLPEEERRAIELAYFDGRTYREVARLLGPARGNGQEPYPQRHAPHARRAGRRRRAGGGGVMTHEEAERAAGCLRAPCRRRRRGAPRSRFTSTPCPRCQAELDGFREVAGALGNSVEPLPEGLWSGIASRLPERHEDEEQLPPMPRLVPGADRPSALPRRPSGAARRCAAAAPSPPSPPSPWLPPPWPSSSASASCRPITRCRTSSRRPDQAGDGEPPPCQTRVTRWSN